MKRTEFAITYSIKNEAQLLPQVIAVARALGCARIYIFFDGTTDSSREIASSFEEIVCFDSITPEQIDNRPAWIDRISPRWNENMDVRKRISTYFAANHAARDGIEWLLCIDPDEVMVPSLTDPLTKESVRNFLDRVPHDCNQVLLKNHEVIPRTPRVSNPFAECTSFHNRFPLTDQVWRYARTLFNSVVSDSKLRGWLSYYIYNARFGGAYPRMMHDPLTGHSIPSGYYLGYWNHKSLVRTSAARDLIFDVHQWRANPGGSLKSCTAGSLLHYFLYDVDSVRAKFKGKPRLHSYTGHHYHRAELARIAREYSAEDFETFFRNCIALEDDALANDLKRRGIMLTVDNVSRLCAESSQADNKEAMPV